MPRKKNRPPAFDPEQPTGHQRWLSLFMDFISHMTISSKELDSAHPVPLGDVLYGAQHRFLEEICEGLDRGIHHFVCLKARQLGISTISLAIDVFWLSVHDRMQGAIITDTEGNRDKFRILLEQYIESLPRGLRVGIRTHNRNNLVLNNGSVLDYLVAGTRKVNSSLGRSRALNFVHATEMSSWGSEEGIASLTASLAQKHPHRLYLFESTARGFNMFYDMWTRAKRDTLTQKAFFIGWWSKNDYRFERGSKEFEEYWTGAYDEAELEVIDKVEQLYGYRITEEQIAWHRYFRTHKITDDDLMRQEYPSFEDEAFVMSGRTFFPIQRVTSDLKFLKEIDGAPVKAFNYSLGETFLATLLEPQPVAKDADLRIWEAPHPNGIYVMGVDVAFGRSDDNDNHCIQVYRCFSDKMVQVAEYATNDCESYQVAWVMAHLAGAYKNIWINFEVNGPGIAVKEELRHLKQQLVAGVFSNAGNVPDQDVFNAIKWYLYHRPDSLGAGYAYGWKTTADNKILILNQMRDAYVLRQVKVRSIGLLEEMQRIVQNGSEIKGEGRSKDDRVFATALACKAWIEWVRSPMIASNQSYDAMMEADRIAAETPGGSMIGRLVESFFLEAEQRRDRIAEAAAWQGVELD